MSDSSCISLFAELATIAVGFASFAAAFVAIWQVMVQRRHNRATMLPHLLIVGRIDRRDDGGFFRSEYELTNCGSGPAFILNFTIKIAGETFVFPKGQAVQNKLEVMFQGNFIQVREYSFEKNEPYPAGKTRVLFSAYQPQEFALPLAFGQIEWEIVYASIYGETQTLRYPSQGTHPSPW